MARKLTKNLTAATITAALLGLTSNALAQERFGQSGSFAIGAERITGFAVSSTEWELDEPPVEADYEEDTQSFFLLSSDPTTPFAAPRVGFDFFVIDGLSIGGYLTYLGNDSESTTTVNGADDDEEAESSVFMFGPRVGYAAMFNDTFGIWPRGGFTYVSWSFEDENNAEVEASVFALSMEAMFVVAPVQHVAFIFGPTFDFTLSGEGEYDNPNVPPNGFNADIDDVKLQSFGIHAGLVAWF